MTFVFYLAAIIILLMIWVDWTEPLEWAAFWFIAVPVMLGVIASVLAALWYTAAFVISDLLQ